MPEIMDSNKILWCSGWTSLCIQDILVSNISSETGYTEPDSTFWFLLVTAGRCWDSSLILYNGPVLPTVAAIPSWEGGHNTFFGIK
jgi:hypothetical protein